MNGPDDNETGPPRDAVIDLRILATSDLHMHVLPYDYVTDRASTSVGLACTATLIREARSETANTLLFDVGDFLQGAPMGDELARAAQAGEDGPADKVHPMIASMVELGYDAITLGNHDFDYGLNFLSRSLAGLPFPVVTTNLSIFAPPGWRLPALLPSAVPFALLQRQFADRDGQVHQLRVGLIGMLPPNSIAGVQFAPYWADLRDMVAVAALAVPQLRALGADVVIALAHSGIGPPEYRPGLENAIVPLAAVGGIDAIVSGDAHQVFPGGPVPESPAIDHERGLIHGRPVVASGFWGSHLGVIDLALERGESGGWRVREAGSQARPIADPAGGCRQPDPKILRLMRRIHDFTIDRVRRPVGETKRLIHSYFALVAPSPATDLVLRAKRDWLNKQLSGTELEGLPLICASAPYRAGGYGGPDNYTRIEPGPVTLRELAGLYPYPNDLAVVRLTGAELAEWVERAASVFNRFSAHGGAQPLIASSTPAYAFDSLCGVDFSIDLSVPARYTPAGRLADPGARRVRDLKLEGRVLDPDEELLLATNSFRVNGGGAYPGARLDRVVDDLQAPMRDLLAAYFASNGPFDHTPEQTWRFAPLEGASALFASSPQAESLVGELAGPCHPRGLDPQGFRIFELELEACIAAPRRLYRR